MPIETTITHSIVCGNPACPGTPLDPTDRMGWLFVIAETYGEIVPPQRVFCSFSCLAKFSNAVANDNAEWMIPTSEPIPPA
jgi:hypothetical protein